VKERGRSAWRRRTAATSAKLHPFRGVLAALLVVAALAALSSIGFGAVSASQAGYGYGYGYGYQYSNPPTCTPPSDQTATEGTSKSFNLGSFTDPDGDGPWQVDVNWGDGKPHDTFAQSSTGALPTRAHTYADNGNYSVTVKITDANGNSGSCSFHVVVANAPPTCGPIVAPLAPVAVNTLVTATAPFTDPGTLDTHTAVMNWDDATTSPGTVTEANGSGTVTATHTYTAAGVYTLTLTVTDKDGASGQCTFQYVVVFNPDDGFVTGGGWIDSPPGAYTANPTLTGKATFGFVAKYVHGSNTPSGETEFEFKAGNLNFKSSSYDLGSLVIAGKKAMYKGSGTINGSGDYAFRVSAIDGNLQGGDGTDRFRIKIWNKTTNAVVYDNQVGGGDYDDPTTALGGGSITIHKS
jgi:PKD repeat protein